MVSGTATLEGFATAYVDATVILGPQSVHKVAEEAAQAVGMQFTDIAIASEPNSSGDPSLLFTYRVPTTGAITGKMQSDVMGALRDRLLARGDERYPYVTLTSA